MRSAQVIPVVVGITLCTASAAILYKWFKTRDSSKDAVDGGSRGGGSKRKRKPKLDKVEMTIDNETMPLVLGRNGNNVKSIEERHEVKITFHEKSDGKQLCEIAGAYENVLQAASVVDDVVKKSKNVTEELIVPKQAYLRISSTLSDICRETVTKIRNSNDGLKDKNLRRLEINGAFANVRKAKQMIEERVRQDEIDTEITREPRFNQRNSPVNSSDENLSKCNSD